MKIKQHLENLPGELTAQPRFFPLKDGATLRECKAPVSKGWQLPENEALPGEGANKGRALGFNIVGHNGGADYLVFDFDHVLSDGLFVSRQAETAYREMMAAIGDTFVEVSASKTGLHVLVKPTAGKFETITNSGEKILYFLDSGKTKKDKDCPKLETFYKSNGRFFILTGDCYECNPQTPIASGAAVDDFVSKHLERLDSIAAANTPKVETPKAATTSIPSSVPITTTDYDEARAMAMLEYINPTEYADWTAVGAALKQMGAPMSV